MQRPHIILQGEALLHLRQNAEFSRYLYSCLSLATLAFSLFLVVPRELCVLFGFPL